MKGEIDRNFYCLIDAYGKENGEDGCGDPCGDTIKCCKGRCSYYRRKWPTPEQFESEYGVKWEGAVYMTCIYPKKTPRTRGTLHSYCDQCPASSGWITHKYGMAISCGGFKPETVCACTSWGKPTVDWRPE